MADERVKRRLAAIFVADVVGYTRHMEQDEAGTLSRLKARRRDVLDPLLLRHEGRLVKILGDGILAEFASAASAVRCAVELQRDMDAANEGLPETRQYVLRIGISLGDVIVEGKDLYGNGVNLAVRLESHGNAGDITISSNVFDQVCREVVAEYDDLGPVSMKNFAKSVHAYRVRPCPQQPPGADGGQSTPLSLPPRPSIAVLPFNTMGANAEHGAFADGLTEDLITELSRTPGLFVIAQHSAFAYKGKPVDVRQIATELGVRYLLEGSARRSAERVRVNVQLVDTLGGGYLWAERYDREIEDIFAVQDDVAARIVEALVGRLIVPPMRNRPKSMKAYDLCVRARSLGWNSAGSPEAIYESIVLLQQAIAIDPSYAEAHGWLAFNLWSTWANAMYASSDNRRLSLEMAKKAVALDANDAQSRWILGYLLAYEGQWSESDAAFDAAIAMDRNSADALIFRAELLAFAGQASEAMDVMEQAFRLNPHPTASYYWEQSLVYYVAGQYEKAIETVRGGPAYRTGARRILAASLAQAGNLNEARQEAALFMANNPNFSIGKWAESQPFRDPETRQLFVEGYRKAGLPE